MLALPPDVDAVGQALPPDPPGEVLTVVRPGTPYGSDWGCRENLGCGTVVQVCGPNANQPDLVVCIAGAERRIRLFIPYPPCGTPEAKTAPKCVEWKVGKP